MTTPPPVVRARLVFSYDGTGFSGWARQPGLRTVQEVLETALSRVMPRAAPPRLTVAGRTDAGVHARAQQAHADIPEGAWDALPGRTRREPGRALRDALAATLGGPHGPRDIVVHDVTPAPAGFHARFSALERRYAYRIADTLEARLPWQRDFVLWHPRPLDVDALSAASATLLGLRDFSPFCRARPGSTAIRDLLEFSWRREADGPDAGLVVATVRADAFCHSMVRSLVGAVLAVGEGRRAQGWLDDVAGGAGRSSAVAVAPAHGLCLEEVRYPPDDALAARAEATRGKRSLD